MKLKSVFLYLLLFFLEFVNAQGISNNWLLGDGNTWPPYATTPRVRINFQSGNDSAFTDNRKMNFLVTQANISDRNGNMLMSSNGIWIADATGDTMLNGSGLNPGAYTNMYISDGLNQVHTNLFLPFPNDSTKYILFHSSGFYQYGPGVQLYYSVIDINLNNGLGAVISKNNLIPIPHLGIGFTACKHANGRDWWIALPSDSFNVINKILLNPNGISILPSQSFINNYPSEISVIHPAFSPDGNHFAFTTCPGAAWGVLSRYMRLFDFDRCSGNFTYLKGFPVQDTVYALPVAFSANSKMLYFSSYQKLFQLPLDSINAVNPVNLVATWDGFMDSSGLYSPAFDLMYLSNNKKIYIVASSRYLTVIESPDSVGISCNVQQHILQTSCLLSTSIPNHPNYFLGKMENSICDTILSDEKYDFKLATQNLDIFPNPASEQFYIFRSQFDNENEADYFTLHNLMGKEVVRQKLYNKETLINTIGLEESIYYWSYKKQSGKIIISHKRN